MKKRAVYFTLIVLIFNTDLHGAELVVMGTNTTAVPGAKVYTVGVQVTQAELQQAAINFNSTSADVGLQELAFSGPIMNLAQTTPNNPTQLQTIQDAYINDAGSNNPVAPDFGAGPPISLSTAGQHALYDTSWWYFGSSGRLTGVADSSGNPNVIATTPAADGSGVYTVGPTSNVGASGALWNPYFPQSPETPQPAGMSNTVAIFGGVGGATDLNGPTFSSSFVNGVFTAPLAQIVASGNLTISYQLTNPPVNGLQGMLFMNEDTYNFLGGNANVDPHAVLDYSTNTIHSELSAGGGVASVGGIQINPSMITTDGNLTSTFSTTTAANLGQAIGANAAQQINFALAGPTVQAWDIHFTGALQGLSTVVLHYDPSLIGSIAESALRIEHYENGAWVVPTGQVVDTVAHTITFQTDGFSPFVLSQVPEPSSVVLLSVGALVIAAYRRQRSNVQKATQP